MPFQIEPLTLIRVLCGLWFIPHIAGKLLHREKAAETFEKAGFRPGPFFLLLAVLMETIGAAGMIAGIHPAAAAILAVLVLAGAGYAVLRINGTNWRWQKQGPEYIVFWALLCLISSW